MAGKIVKETKLVAFLATPHTGSSLATILKIFTEKFSSSYVKLLTNDNDQLDDLNDFYRDLCQKQQIRTAVYYEKYKHKGVLVVPKESADPGVPGTRAIPLDVDHDTISKPADKDLLLFKSVCRHIKKTIQTCCPRLLDDNSFETEGYEHASKEDRRDLKQKLIDADREFEYSKANEYQNKFAQYYYKLGLHTPAKKRNDELLSDIQQRFQTHVFVLLCKEASEVAHC